VAKHFQMPDGVSCCVLAPERGRRRRAILERNAQNAFLLVLIREPGGRRFCVCYYPDRSLPFQCFTVLRKPYWFFRNSYATYRNVLLHSKFARQKNRRTITSPAIPHTRKRVPGERKGDHTDITDGRKCATIFYSSLLEIRVFSENFWKWVAALPSATPCDESHDADPDAEQGKGGGFGCGYRRNYKKPVVRGLTAQCLK
jgi:hypothetical protein